MFDKKPAITGMLGKALVYFWDILVVSSRKVTPLLYVFEPEGGFMHIMSSNLGKYIVLEGVFYHL